MSLKEALDWGQAEGITFNPAKSELQHFSRRRADKDPWQTPSVSHGNMSVSENTTRPYTKWLGIYLDKNLTFKWYVQLLTGKALKVANALKFIGNESRGAPPRLLRQATIACVLSVAYFGSEVWCPGRNRTTPKGKLFVLTSARAILPVYRTTPSAALFRVAGLPPPLIELDRRVRAAVLRIHKLDPRHPLRRRAQWVDKYNRRVSRLSGWILSLPTIEYIDPLVLPPWASTEGWHASIRRVTQNSTQLPTSIPFNDMLAYTDGSRLGPNISAGREVVIHRAGRIVYEESRSTNRSVTSFDTEVKAAAEAMSAAFCCKLVDP
ncbi:hypothetical protein K3495_g15520 [Podosphaera aphanis]|nr:hypothetical protein K3495_g15520 [Podosphaera aphanis]